MPEPTPRWCVVFSTAHMIAPDSREEALSRVLCGEPPMHRALNIGFYLMSSCSSVRVVTKLSGVGYTRDHLDRASRTKVKISCNTFQHQVCPFNHRCDATPKKGQSLLSGTFVSNFNRTDGYLFFSISRCSIHQSNSSRSGIVSNLIVWKNI